MSLKTVVTNEVFLVLLGISVLAGLGVGLAVWAKHDAETTPPPPATLRKAQGDLAVWEDQAHNVRCYYAEHGSTGALSCVVIADAGPR